MYEKKLCTHIKYICLTFVRLQLLIIQEITSKKTDLKPGIQIIPTKLSLFADAIPCLTLSGYKRLKIGLL